MSSKWKLLPKLLCTYWFWECPSWAPWSILGFQNPPVNFRYTNQFPATEKKETPSSKLNFFYSCLNCKSKFLYQSHNKQNYETIRKQLPSQVYNLASSHKDHLEVQQLSTHWPCLKKRKIKKIWGGQPDEYLKYKKIGTSDYFQIQNKQNYMI